MRVCILGRGNVGTHLFRAMQEKCDVSLHSSRNMDELPLDADVYIIAVKDDAISGVAGSMPAVNGIVAHTSGTQGIRLVSDLHPRGGVFYPMQTFSKDVEMAYDTIPFFVDGATPETAETLKTLASMVSDSVTVADDNRRKCLHVAAVFACNFANHMWTIADSLLSNEGMDISVMKPLIRETAAKIERTSPLKAQTGPAARCDYGTISRHLDYLQDDDNARAMYEIISQSIIKSIKV